MGNLLKLSAKHILYKLILCFLFYHKYVTCFNVETDYFVTHNGQSDSQFGFSVAIQNANGRKWIIVGAPEAESNQPNLTKPGAVFRCSPITQGDCEEVIFDRKGNDFDGSQFIDDKNNQWFGASVASRGGVVAACAPRYVWYSIKKNRREPIGGCFLITNDGSPLSYSPCRTNAWGYHRQGTCQAGLGLALSKGGNRLYVGAAGSWYWQGQVFYQSLLNTEEKSSTAEAPKEFDMSYMGYSIAVGNFDADTEEDIAVGVPRGADLKGKVVLFNYRLDTIYNITGDQVGSYFGYSIAILDFDGDKLDDIVVGAPWYTQLNDSDIKYEAGAVFCYKHTEQHNYFSFATLFGRKSRSHFGLSMTTLGDLNADGFDDLAVGAPRDGFQEKGGVYIFLGSDYGLQKTPSQILLAEELTNKPISTFGWSLSAGEDLDGNEYPDLVVGAHDSASVHVFRARPVALVQATIKIKSKSGTFDLDSKSCSLHDGSPVPCVPVQYCVSYTGLNVDPELVFAIRIHLDSLLMATQPRLFFLTHEGRSGLNTTLLVQKNILKCHTFYIFSMPNPQDKLTPLKVELFYDMAVQRGYVDPLVLRVIIPPPGEGRENSVKDIIYFQNNCGEDNICIPDLSVTASMKEKEYILGSRKNLYLDLDLLNSGDDAYLTKLTVQIPDEIHFSKFNVTLGEFAKEVTPFCTTVMILQDGTDDIDSTKPKPVKYVVCEIGNPLPSNANIDILLVFQPNPNIILDSVLDFGIVLNSTNKEYNASTIDNKISISLPVIMKSEVDLRGISWPDTQFHFNISNYGKSLLLSGRPIKHEEEVGPEIAHIYDVVNRGPSDLPMVELHLLWPTKTMEGLPLLYLLEVPNVVPKSIKCEATAYVNYMNISITPPLFDSFDKHSVLSENVSVLKFYSREKRSLPPDLRTLQLISAQKPTVTSGFAHKGSKIVEDLLSCGLSKCSLTKCHIPVLKAGDHIFVRARSRLWVDTLRKLSLTDTKITSRLVLLSNRQSKEETMFWSQEVKSLIKARNEIPVASLSWLIWLGSIVAGLLVLALLILLLWMLGFFKRRRPTDETEAELINKNVPQNNGRL